MNDIYDCLNLTRLTDFVAIANMQSFSSERGNKNCTTRLNNADDSIALHRFCELSIGTPLF